MNDDRNPGTVSDRAALEELGRQVFAAVTDSSDFNVIDLPDELGIAMIHAVRGGGKLFIAPDRSMLYSASSQNFQAGLDAFRAGARSSSEKLLPLSQRTPDGGADSSGRV